MKEARQASKLDPEHYVQVRVTADQLADEVLRRFRFNSDARRFDHLIHHAVVNTLIDYFAGNLKLPPTDPPRGAPHG